MSRVAPLSLLTRRSRLTVVTAAVAAGLLGGCGSTDAGSPSGPAATATTPDTSPAPTPSPSPTAAQPPSPGSGPSIPPPADGSVPAPVSDRPEVKAAIADAAGRRGVAPAEAVLATYQQVTWTDGSLGCPQKGRSYTQAEVDGELLVVRVGGATLHYHARTGGPFTYCADPGGAYSPRSGSDGVHRATTRPSPTRSDRAISYLARSATTLGGRPHEPRNRHASPA